MTSAMGRTNWRNEMASLPVIGADLGSPRRNVSTPGASARRGRRVRVFLDGTIVRGAASGGGPRAAAPPPLGG